MKVRDCTLIALLILMITGCGNPAPSPQKQSPQTIEEIQQRLSKQRDAFQQHEHNPHIKIAAKIAASIHKLPPKYRDTFQNSRTDGFGRYAPYTTASEIRERLKVHLSAESFVYVAFREFLRSEGHSQETTEKWLDYGTRQLGHDKTCSVLVLAMDDYLQGFQP